MSSEATLERAQAALVNWYKANATLLVFERGLLKLEQTLAKGGAVSAEQEQTLISYRTARERIAHAIADSSVTADALHVAYRVGVTSRYVCCSI